MNDILNFRWRQANQGFKIVARPRLCKFKLASLTPRDSVRLNKHFEFILAWSLPTCIQVGDSVRRRRRRRRLLSSSIPSQTLCNFMHFRRKRDETNMSQSHSSPLLLSVGCDS